MVDGGRWFLKKSITVCLQPPLKFTMQQWEKWEQCGGGGLAKGIVPPPRQNRILRKHEVCHPASSYTTGLGYKSVKIHGSASMW